MWRVLMQVVLPPMLRKWRSVRAVWLVACLFLQFGMGEEQIG